MDRTSDNAPITIAQVPADASAFENRNEDELLWDIFDWPPEITNRSNAPFTSRQAQLLSYPPKLINCKWLRTLPNPK